MGHPKAVGHAVANPVKTAKAIGKSVANDWNSGPEGQGKIVGNVLITVGTGGVAVAKGPQLLAKVGKIARTLKAAGQVAEDAGTAGQIAKDAGAAAQIAKDAGTATKMEAAAQVAQDAKTTAKAVENAASKERVVAGYTVEGGSSVSGGVYKVRIPAIMGTEQSEGLQALLKALNNEAKAAGASEIQIVGENITNPRFLNPALAKRMAERFGLTYEQIDANTAILRGKVK